MKANCYECQYQGTVPGSCHSSCHHPANKETLADPIMSLIGIFGGVGRLPGVSIKNELNVVGNPHGIRSGWFMWPMNFDPVWLENCDGFKAKEVEKTN